MNNFKCASSEQYNHYVNTDMAELEKKVLSNYQLEDGTVVRVNISEELSYLGVIVGKACNIIANTYIIRCTDGTIPNETYSYSVSIAPLFIIETLD